MSLPRQNSQLVDADGRPTREFYTWMRGLMAQTETAEASVPTVSELSDVAISSLTDGDALVYDNSIGRWVNGAVAGGGGYDEGTSFPGSPSSGDKFYRTDLNWLCFYDGTRWLTVHEYLADFANQQTLQPITTQSYFASVTLRRDYGVYLTRFHGSYYIGPTNNGSNYRTLNLVWGNSASSETTLYTTDSSAAAASTNIEWSIAINSVISSSAFYLAISNTRTGLPSGLYGNFAIAYRLVVT